LVRILFPALTATHATLTRSHMTHCVIWTPEWIELLQHHSTIMEVRTARLFTFCQVFYTINMSNLGAASPPQTHLKATLQPPYEP
jgi:hypothetical protein